MLKKYKNGFFFDTEMKTKKGEIVDYETQLKRYKIGTKANWRNPNSTDVKTITSIVTGKQKGISRITIKN